MTKPPIPDALIVRRNAHGLNHYFTATQMDEYGRDCAQAALVAQAGEIEVLRKDLLQTTAKLIVKDVRYKQAVNGRDEMRQLFHGARAQIAAMTKGPK